MTLDWIQVIKATCDVCGETYDTGDFVPYYETAEHAAEELADSDWIVDLSVEPNTVLCPDCVNPTDDDEPEAA